MKKLMLLFSIITATTIYAQAPNKDEQEVRGLLTIVENGWNNKSGESFSMAFAEVHDYVVVNGFYFPNFTRAQNAQTHQRLFDGPFKNQNIKLNVDKVTFFRADLAQVIALGAGYDKSGPVPADPTVIMTVIAEKKSDGWKIISFHNHNLETFNGKGTPPVPLNVMYASWYKK